MGRVLLFILIIIISILISVIVYYIYNQLIEPEEKFTDKPTPPKKKKPKKSKPEDKNISDMDSNINFFNLSAYDKIPTDPEPDIRGVSELELSPIDSRIRFKNIIPGIDRIR